MTSYESPQIQKAKRKSKRSSAVQARSRAQQIAFGPIIFYAAVVMRNTGLLTALSKTEQGLGMDELCRRSGLSEYAVSVLMDLAVDADIVHREGDRWRLADAGYFLMDDPMTQVNMDFVRDICYRALPFLEQSLVEGRPAGLHTLGDWPNVYEGLSKLEEPARSSWFRFDHYYSDTVFDSLLPVIFDRPVSRLMDIGANTGKWALKCLCHDEHVEMTLVDLPGQLQIAESNIAAAGFRDRVSLHPMDVLVESNQFPGDCDVIWMSQFLDCFGPEQIKSILARLLPRMNKNTRLVILEPFSDRQQFSAASLSLNATSLYFTCVANGTSRMYRYDEFRPLVEQSGLHIESEQHLSFGHTLMICRLPSAG
ncbi:methyltransferase domain-containing protein [Proteobacteria bacterium 005FR1]|nr:methyltransferase domain-containing protein [Proteobacteria bacterium 005FR1]